jgi:glycosyltransferase involved in cell wall biosynthesis
MKIVQIDQHYQFGGGTEHYMLAISAELEKAGHEVTILYGKKGDLTPDKSGRRALQVSYIEDYYPTFNKTTLTNLTEVIRRENPDIIHIHNIRNEDVVRTCASLAVTIRHVQDPSFVCLTHWKLLPNFDLCTDPLGVKCISRGCVQLRPGLRTLFRKHREIKIHKKLPRILVSSHYVKWMLGQLSVPSEKITVIHPFTSLTTLRPDTLSDKHNIVLFVGKMHPIKGVDILLRALPYVDTDYRALFVGEGEYLDAYKDLAKQLGIGNKVEFTGWVPLERLSEYYADCSVLVVPSVWVETFGLIGIDAMAHEKPVVAFDTGGIPDWLTHNETGFLVGRKDIRGMAEKISLLLKDQPLAKKMGKAGRLKVEQHFSSEIFIANLLKIYERALSHK